MASEAAAVFDMAMAVAAMAAQGVGTRMKIEEGIADYNQAITDIQARSAATTAEATRRIGTTKEEGVLSLKEQGAQAAFEGRMAMTQAEMVASSEEAKLGASGVRAKGSPLAAAQQNVDLAFAAADRTIERGSAGMAMGGVRLKTGLADIGAQETLLTAEYARKRAGMLRKRDELQKNKTAMVALAVVGGAPSLGTSFYNLTNTFGG
ncbi:MAG TPA: hypothetical protein ENI27_05830 [bacterium]|nr:hypothetical protein [bacterium]